MKKFLLLLLLPFTVAANPIDDNCPQFTVHGAPVTHITTQTQYLCKQNYAINYRYDTKTAEYVVEHVSNDDVAGTAERADNFHPDTDIPEQYRSVLSDYAGHPYDRGHLVPAGDNKQSASIMSESFSLANMVPQVPNNNRGIWNKLEATVRGWVNSGRDIYVVSGTYYQPGYKVIGNGVGVPTHLWKVVIDNTNNQAVAFLLPNQALPVKDLPKYAMSVAQLESVVGIDFMPTLTVVGRMEIEQPMSLISWPGL